MFQNQPEMTTPTSAAAGIGHNSGDARSLDPVALRAELLSGSAALALRVEELRNASLRAPTSVADDDEETAKKLGDFVKQLAAALKSIEAVRVAEKAPFLAAASTVDGVFQSWSAPLADAKKRVELTLGTFLRAKQQREQAAALERQRQEREAAEEKRRAAEAEEQRKRNEAAEAKRRADEAARKAREAAEAAEATNRQKAAAAAAAAKAASEAEKAAKAVAKAETATDKAVARETAEARKEERIEDAKAGKFATTRGDFGSAASLREYWDFANLDRATLDLEALRQHIPAEALERAVRSFIRAGGRELAGVSIFQSDAPVVR